MCVVILKDQVREIGSLGFLLELNLNVAIARSLRPRIDLAADCAVRLNYCEPIVFGGLRQESADRVALR